jgi:MFS family permease
MMLGRSAMVLVTALLMFPQIVETIYSPALTDISRYFSVSAAKAAQTLSLYFIGFAVGVLFWGRFSDRHGRRPALLAGSRSMPWAVCWRWRRVISRYCWPPECCRRSVRQRDRW